MARLITVEPGQTLERIALLYCGTIDGVADLVLDNRELLVDGFDTDLVGGEQLAVWDAPLQLADAWNTSIAAPPEVPMTTQVIVQPGQTLENIALQYYGSVDAVVDLVWDNRALLASGFATDLVGGELLSIRPVPYDAERRAGIVKLQVIPASGKMIPPTVVPLDGDYNDDHNDDHLLD